MHLNPTQVLIPNDRPRYYCIAILGLDSDSHKQHLESSCERETPQHDERIHSWFLSKLDKDDGPLSKSRKIQTKIGPLGVEDERDVKITKLRPISDFLDFEGQDYYLDEEAITTTTSTTDSLFVSQKKLKSTASWCFDIVTPHDRRSACFTHSYGNFIRGTGSVLYIEEFTKPASSTETVTKTECIDDKDQTIITTKKRLKVSSHSGDKVDRFKLIPAHKREYDSKWADGLDLLNRLRYFSGTEIARLMGFPVVSCCTTKTTNNNIVNVRDDNPPSDGRTNFMFPPNITRKQQWKLLGNSLNVKVAAKIVEVSIYLALE